MDAPGIRLRESPRIEIAGRARIQIGSSAPLIDAALLDLSATGMGLATGVAVPKPVVGEPCAFDLALDGVRIEGSGVVIWSRRARPDRGDAPNVGVHFRQLEGAGESEVAAIVEQRLATTRRPSVAARAIFAPIVERAVEPAVVPAQVTAPVSLSVKIPDATAIPDSAPIASSEAISVTVPIPQSGPSREARVSVEDEAPSPARRGWWIVGLAGAAVAVAAVLMLWSFFGEERREAPTVVGASTAASESDAPPASEAQAIVPEPARAEQAAVVEPAAAPATSGDLEPAGGPAVAGAGLTTRPDSLASAPEPLVAAAAREPAAPASAPETDPASAGPAARARRLLAIEPGNGGGGEVVALRADAPFREQDVFAALIGQDPPRYLLRLSGIELPWRPPELAVGSPLVHRVRTGLHSTPRGPELHVVLDLSTRAVDHSFEVEGDVLRVHLRPRTP